MSEQHKFDELGPIIVNSNGTLSRIPNWNSLTELEQNKTLRLIAKRNKQRISILENTVEEVAVETCTNTDSVQCPMNENYELMQITDN
jgi:hypothetical protein